MITYVDAKDVKKRTPGVISIHDEQDFAGMRAASALTSEVLDLLVPMVQPGVTTASLDRFIGEFAKDNGALPATLGYRGYRYNVCTSINHVVCHGMPSEKPIKDGDIVNIDITLIKDGWYGDSSRMYAAGAIPRRAERLIEVTYECLRLGLEAAKPGNTTGDIGAAIQQYAESQRMSVVRDFVGHGVGKRFHDEPNIFHYGVAGTGVELKPGMIFTIEPMINLGKPDVKILPDGWTAVTRDRSLTAQCEHSIGITDTGNEIFTVSKAGLFNPYEAMKK